MPYLCCISYISVSYFWLYMHLVRCNNRFEQVKRGTLIHVAAIFQKGHMSSTTRRTHLLLSLHKSAKHGTGTRIQIYFGSLLQFLRRNVLDTMLIHYFELLVCLHQHIPHKSAILIWRWNYFDWQIVNLRSANKMVSLLVWPISQT